MTDDDDDESWGDDLWVRIMADYSADGVWQRDGTGDSADALPISPPLRTRLRAWQARYDEHDPWEEDPAPFDVAAFAAEGLAIAALVKRELGHDWTVFYHDVERAGSEPKMPRSYFEYEVIVAG